MTGIDDLFREYSEPDEFVSQYQMELFAWHHKQSNKRSDERPARKEAKRRWVNAYVKRRRREDAEWAAKLRERQNRINQDYRARKREDGKCSRCPALRIDGKSMCQRHLEWERARVRAA